MADSGTAKSNLGNTNPEEQQPKEVRRSTERTEPQDSNKGLDPKQEHDLTQAFEAEENQVEEERHTNEQIEQQDLNQGMDTGTHDSTRYGVDWGPEYQIRDTKSRKPQKKDEPNKPSK
jgi:hypothetical protein